MPSSGPYDVGQSGIVHSLTLPLKVITTSELPQPGQHGTNREVEQGNRADERREREENLRASAAYSASAAEVRRDVAELLDPSLNCEHASAGEAGPLDGTWARRREMPPALVASRPSTTPLAL